MNDDYTGDLSAPQKKKDIRFIIALVCDVVLILSFIFIILSGGREMPKNPVLKYKMTCLDILDKNSRFEPYVFKGNGYEERYSFTKIKTTTSKKKKDLSEPLKTLTLCRIDIKNIGRAKFDYESFTDNSGLKIKMLKGNLIGVSVSKNAGIVPRIKINKQLIDIIFDEIMPNSGFTLNLLFENPVCNYDFEIIGKSDFFNRIEPIDYETALLESQHMEYRGEKYAMKFRSENTTVKMVILAVMLVFIVLLTVFIFIKIRAEKRKNIIYYDNSQY